MSTIGWNIFPELTQAEVIYEKPNYVIVVTPADWLRQDLGQSLGCYCIVNKNYKTIESTGNSLAIMMKALNIMDEELTITAKEVFKDQKENSDVGNIVPFR